MNSDAHYLIGSSHDVCEDYAIATDGFACLSDGCSCVMVDGKRVKNSMVDLGARILCKAASDTGIPGVIKTVAEIHRRALNVPRHAMNATLLVIFGHEDSASCWWWGDGMFAARHRGESRWDKWEIKWLPCPSYLFNPVEGTMLVNGKEQADHAFTVYKEDYDLVVAISDGYATFPEDVTDRLLDFRGGMAGRFVVRHLRGVTRELAAEGLLHTDDLSMAAIHNG